SVISIGPLQASKGDLRGFGLHLGTSSRLWIDVRDCPMNASKKEVELKLELPPESLPSIKQVPLLKALKPSPSRAAEISVYFDTDKYKLRTNGFMLRVRRIGHRHVQTR